MTARLMTRPHVFPLLLGLCAGWCACSSAPAREDDLVVSPPTAAAAAQEAALPGTIEGHFNRADRFLDERNHAEALLELQEAARRLDPNDPRMVRFHERTGGVYLSSNDLPAAKEAYTKAIKLAKDIRLDDEIVAEVYVGMALCLAKEDNRAYAVKFLKKALDQHPSDDVRKLAEEHIRRLSAPSDPQP